MKIDTLNLRIETIKNAKYVLNDFSAEYALEINDVQIQLDKNNINISILGKNIQIPYYSIDLGKQIDISDLYNPVYESAKIEALSVEEITEKIKKEFTFECKVKGE